MLHLDGHITLNEDAIKAPNLADRFSSEDLAKISTFCYEGYERDLRSRIGWFRKTEAAMDLAMQVSQEKSFPWPNASNIVFPLITIASLQFHSRAYPAIIQGSRIVKSRVAGTSTPEAVAKADNVSTYMSYQLLEEDQPWEEQHDRMLLNISIVGCAFKKSFYDPTLGHNVSQLVRARDLVIDYYAKSVEGARRKTHVLPVYRNEIVEKCHLRRLPRRHQGRLG
jgi:chaperonin GroES